MPRSTCRTFRSLMFRAAGSATLLAFALQGCVPYNSSYMKDESSRRTAKGLDRSSAQAGEPRINVVSAPAAASPAVPLTVRLEKTLTGAEAEVVTVTEKSYKNSWSPLLIPMGALVTAISPVLLVFSALSTNDRPFNQLTGLDKKLPCDHGTIMTGWMWLVGVNTSCDVGDSRVAEVSTPTGKTVSEEAPLSGVLIEFSLAEHGGKPVVGTGKTDASGTVSMDVASFFRGLAEPPSRVEVTMRALPEGTVSRTVELDEATTAALFKPVREEREGDKALSDGKGVVALEHYSLGHEAAMSDAVREGLRKKAAGTYRALLVKPPPPEDTRRLLVQAETLAKNGDPSGALAKLGEAGRKSPWLPAVRNNLAYAYAMARDYDKAIEAMNGYLELVPDGPEARQARDRIYEWETLRTIPASPGGAGTAPAEQGGRGRPAPARGRR